jgi:hypothetical protein
VKTKNTAWTAEEDAVLAKAARESVSPARLSVRLHRSVGSIKRRMRELGLAGNRRGPREATQSSIRVQVDPITQVAGWLAACRSGDPFALMAFYGEDPTLECACAGPAVYAGFAAILEYWSPKLRSKEPRRFSLVRTQLEDERVVVDYLSYEGKLVRMILSFDAMGKIVHSECGPRECKSPPPDHHMSA